MAHLYTELRAPSVTFTQKMENAMYGQQLEQQQSKKEWNPESQYYTFHTHKDPSLLGCYAMLMGKELLTFPRTLMTLYWGSIMFPRTLMTLYWGSIMFPRTLMPLYSESISTRRRHVNPLKCWSVFTNQLSITSLKTRNFNNTSVRTSDLTH